MKKFSQLKDVVITEDGHPLRGLVGRVHRIRVSDDGAWIRMCSKIPESERIFPSDDPGGRGNDVLLYPNQCDNV